jgi:hypothetical protein
MITELYLFSPGSYVVADEWNANFKTLYQVNIEHSTAITDAYNNIAFPNSDLTAVFNAVKSQYNSYAIGGNTVSVSVENEYYKTLSSGEDLVINIPTGMCGEARVLIQLQEDRSLLPFSVNYAGTTIINHYNNYAFWAGYYYIMIYETNGVAQVKLIWTGV